MYRDFFSPGRSAVMACEGMAATSHPLASEIAIATLRAGGTAADAAVAAVAALCVLEPHMTGIGGDCFCLVAKPGAPIWGYNGSGRAAATARAEALWALGARGRAPARRSGRIAPFPDRRPCAGCGRHHAVPGARRDLEGDRGARATG